MEWETFDDAKGFKERTKRDYINICIYKYKEEHAEDKELFSLDPDSVLLWGLLESQIEAKKLIFV